MINFSISGGANPYTDAVELAFLDAFNAGISVNASAGNAGPGAGTADHGGPWVTTVGASTSPRFFSHDAAPDRRRRRHVRPDRLTITHGIASATPVVLARRIPGENALCQSNSRSPAQLAPTGQDRRLPARPRTAALDKSFNVKHGGAAGMILYNPIKQDVETDNHWRPDDPRRRAADGAARVHQRAHGRQGDVGAGRSRRRRSRT